MDDRNEIKKYLEDLLEYIRFLKKRNHKLRAVYREYISSGWVIFCEFCGRTYTLAIISIIDKKCIVDSTHLGYEMYESGASSITKCVFHKDRYEDCWELCQKIIEEAKTQ